jgi:hypothetical protein
VPQAVGERGQRRVGGPPDHGQRVQWQQQRHHGQPDGAADQRVEEPGQRHAGLRRQGRHQHGGGGGLDDQRRAAAQRRGDQDGTDHDERDLPRSPADQDDDGVADADADGDADDQFGGALDALPHRGRQGDHRGDRREERLRAADQVVCDEPGETGRDAGLHGQREAAAHPLPGVGRAGPGAAPEPGHGGRDPALRVGVGHSCRP